MKNINNYFLSILLVCLISGVFLFISTLALQDIYHNIESNLATEWNIVRLSYFMNGILYLVVVVAFLKFRKQLKRSY